MRKEHNCISHKLQGAEGKRRRMFYGLVSEGASLVAQPVKNLPAMRETWVPSLSWEDPLKKGKATHSSTLANCTVHGVSKSRTRLSNFRFLHFSEHKAHFCYHVVLYTLSPGGGIVPWSHEPINKPCFFP